MDVLDEEKEDIGLEMDMELETLRNLSPAAITPLTGIVDSQETHADAGRGREETDSYREG